jgi:hypothetical protein
MGNPVAVFCTAPQGLLLYVGDTPLAIAVGASTVDGDLLAAWAASSADRDALAKGIIITSPTPGLYELRRPLAVNKGDPQHAEVGASSQRDVAGA